MKKLSTNWFTQISKEELEKLTSVINETLGTGLNLFENKTFTTADLWNIQRQGKRRVQRRTFS